MVELTDKITVHNMDCMDYMKGLEDNAFDLAIVDPPYGIDLKMQKFTKPSRPNSYKGNPKHKGFNDSNAPDENYFNELIRVSNEQIVWGGQYLCHNLPISGSWIFWHKMNGVGSHFADGEFSWTSFSKSSRMVSISQFHGTRGGIDRIHPTQKPVKLYEWILKNYANEGDKILDTHLGSGSSAIACHNYGYKFVGIELDEDYFNDMVKRFKQVTAQTTLF